MHMYFLENYHFHINLQQEQANILHTVLVSVCLSKWVYASRFKLLGYLFFSLIKEQNTFTEKNNRLSNYLSFLKLQAKLDHWHIV